MLNQLGTQEGSTQTSSGELAVKIINGMEASLLNGQFKPGLPFIHFSDIYGVGLPLNHVLEARKTLLDVSERLNGHVALPSSFHIEFDPTGKKPPSASEGTVKVAYRHPQDGAVKLSPTTEATWTHEYGHVVFRANLETIAPKYAEKIREVDKAIQTLQGKQFDIRRPFWDPSTETHKLTPEAAKNIAALEKQEVALKEQRLYLEGISRPYNELFADLTEVVRGGNPEAMRDAVSHGSLEAANTQEPLYNASGKVAVAPLDDKAMAETRNFKGNNRVEGWKYSQDHCYFGPVRRYIWDRLFSNSQYGKSPGKIAKVVLTSIGKEMEQVMKDRTDLLDSPDEINRRLIKRIDSELGTWH